MEAVTRVFGLAGLFAGGLAVAGMLHRLGDLPWLAVGWEDPAGWLAVVPPEDAVMSVLRLIALAGTYWLLVTTACYTLARASRLPGAVRSVRWATLPVVRRVADRAVAVVLAGSSVSLAVPGLAAATVVPPPAVSAPSDLPGDPPAPSAPGSPGPAGEPEEAAVHIVLAGDNLWAITAQALGAGASNAEIHASWRAVIDQNREHLRSGDPDLIYPGEHVVLPAPL